MEENSSPQATSPSIVAGSAELATGLSRTRLSGIAPVAGHRAWRRPAAFLGTLLTSAFLAGGIAPAHASTPLTPITTASSNTTVGMQIFANLNLMGATATPTGTATFRLYSPADTTCSFPMFTSTVRVADTSINSAPFTATSAGVYRWTASYGGDSNYYGTRPTACSYAAADVTVSKARNVLTVTAKAPANDILVSTATLSGYSPNGTMTFVVTAPGDTWCSGAPVFTATVAVNGAGTYTSPGFAPSAPGTYTWRAKYSGDEDNMGAWWTACLYSAGAVTYHG
ncbi:MAG TPA: hypothetical protein VM942_02255 [Acidimicrobiales bacterium]|nr:hypothetical protein [Acidimicrobiales bacterium]